MRMKTMKKSNQHSSSSFDDKWPPEISKDGYTQVPNFLLKRQAELGLNSSELVILLQLWSFDFGSRTAEPAHSTVAKSVGLTSSAVRHNIASLENKGFLKRNFRVGSRNEYNLAPAINKLRSHSYSHPAKKRTGVYQKPGRPPPQKIDTKEYSPIRINKKTESIKVILENRFKEN